MNEWKQAFGLAAFEWKVSSQSAIIFFFLNILYFLIVFSFLPIVEGGTTVVGDILFIIIFLIMPSSMKPKDLRLQKISGEVWAAPPVIMLQQLPILKSVIVKSRFILYFFYSFPNQLIFLIFMYVLTPEIREMSLGSYLAFAIIWLAINIYIGCIMPTSDGGGIINWKTMLGSSFFYIVLGVAVFSLFHFVLDIGFVEWTLKIAQDLPLAASGISILLAWGGFIYWQRSLKKTMEKLDYL